MKSDIDIKDDVLAVITGSELEEAVTGIVTTTRRPADSTLEDITIAVTGNRNGEIQEAYVQVNIHVRDIIRDDDGLYEEDQDRLRELCQIAADLLKVQRGDCFRMTLDSQTVEEEDGRKGHVICNTLLYRQCNEGH